MTKGIPLDDYLAATSGLSDDQLEQQLFSGSDFGTPKSQKGPAEPDVSKPTATTTQKTKPKRPTDANDIEALLSNALEELEAKDEISKGIDVSVKTASHAVKVISPLLAAASKWADPEKEPEKLNELMSKVLGRVRTDAAYVIEAYGVPGSHAPAWLTSQVSGQIMGLLVTAIERNNGAVLETDNRRYLQPLIDHANNVQDINSSIYGQPSSPKWQLINATMMATADVMAEYHSFNYFHDDPAQVSQLITEYLNDRVIHESLEPLAERFGLDEAEKAYLGVSLIRQAGNVLATCWATNMVQTFEHLKSMNKETRNEAMFRGYPLDKVFEEFEGVYQGLELSAESAIRTLSPGREISMGSKHGTSMG